MGRLGGSGGRVGPRAQIGRGTAVETLEGGIVAGLGEQLQSDGRLAFPFGSAREKAAGRGREKEKGKEDSLVDV